MPGHWEGDLIFGTYNSQIATLVERHARYVMLAKVSGKEMADHKYFTLSTDIGLSNPGRTI